jgi:hypothetical protein
MKVFQKYNVRVQECWPNTKLKEIKGRKHIRKLKIYHTTNPFIWLSIPYEAQTLKMLQEEFCSIK